MMREEPEWKKITPEHLHAAIEHLRKEFQISHYGWSDVTQNSCLCSLHPDLVNQGLVSQKQAEVQQGLTAVGPQGKERFQKLIKQGTAPSVFRAHFDLYYDILVILLRRAFGELLKIALANWDALDLHPADWAKRQSSLMVKNLLVSAEYWIKHACDVQQLPAPDRIREEFEETVFWRKWQAPKLIYMQPAGNAPYDPKTVWSREDQARTKELLTARSKRFVEFLDLSLEKMAGASHVKVAQDTQYSERTPSEPPKTQADATDSTHMSAGARGGEARGRIPDPTTEMAQRQAVMKKIQDPQSYANITVPEASLYFGVHPRTIYRWLDEGRLRDGGRRGTITTESVRVWEKKRSRKRRNKTNDFS
jgi:hypothetical protein